MSRTEHPRRAKRPEHSDQSPRFTPRPNQRRTSTRRQAVLATLRAMRT